MARGDPAEIADIYHSLSRIATLGVPCPRCPLPGAGRRLQASVGDAPLELEGSSRLSIPPDPGLATLSLAEAILTRRSATEFQPVPLPVEHLATALYLGNGIRRGEATSGAAGRRRNAPSAGDPDSVEIFPIVLDVAGAGRGIYRYDGLRHELVALHAGNYRRWLATMVLAQGEYASAGAALVLACGLARQRARYGVRGLRLGLLDAGHVSENLHLAATSLALDVRATAEFLENEVDRALGLDGRTRASVLIVLLGARGGR